MEIDPHSVASLHAGGPERPRQSIRKGLERPVADADPLESDSLAVGQASGGFAEQLLEEPGHRAPYSPSQRAMITRWMSDVPE